MDEVRFCLAAANHADIEVHWPSGVVDKLDGTAVNRIVTLVEGEGEKK